MFREPIVEIKQDLINQKMSVEDRKEFVNKCPRKVYKFNEMNQEVEIENSHNCNLCIECYRFADDHGMGEAVKLGENDHKYNFKVESTGALPPAQIVKKALIIMKKKIEDFEKNLQDNVNV